MKIAICDDEQRELSGLSTIMDSYCKEKKISFTYHTFDRVDRLLDAIQKESYDILLLDVLMPEMNGIEAAEKIRTFNETIKIIFLTSSREFAVESYAVNAYTYLLKPATRQVLYHVFDKLVDDFQKPEEGLLVKFKGGSTRIVFSKLAFVEVLNKTLYFHLTDGQVKEIAAPLSDYEDKLLCRPEFIRVHRAFVVNMWQIQDLNLTEIITYAGQRIPVSRRLYSQVRTMYMEHLFIENGVK